MSANQPRAPVVSRTWAQAAVLVFVFGFTLLLYLAYRANVEAPPLPARVLDTARETLFTREDILAGQQVFLRNGLMEYGSIFGHGAYLGPDYTADYLRRAATIVRDALGGQDSDQARARTLFDFKTNRYDAQSATLSFTAEQAAAFLAP